MYRPHSFVRYIRHQGKVPDDFGMEWIGHPPPDRVFCGPGPDGLDPGAGHASCKGASGRHYCEPTMNERKGAELVEPAIAADRGAAAMLSERHERRGPNRDEDAEHASQLVDEDAPSGWRASQLMSPGSQSQTVDDCIGLLAGLAATQEDEGEHGADDDESGDWFRATQVGSVGNVHLLQHFVSL
jgi:hypothetical protein